MLALRDGPRFQPRDGLLDDRDKVGHRPGSPLLLEQPAHRGGHRHRSCDGHQVAVGRQGRQDGLRAQQQRIVPTQQPDGRGAHDRPVARRRCPGRLPEHSGRQPAHRRDGGVAGPTHLSEPTHEALRDVVRIQAALSH